MIKFRVFTTRINGFSISLNSIREFTILEIFITFSFITFKRRKRIILLFSLFFSLFITYTIINKTLGSAIRNKERRLGSLELYFKPLFKISSASTNSPYILILIILFHTRLIIALAAL